MPHDDLNSVFAYNRWANDRVVAACRELGQDLYEREPVPGWPSVRATLVHIADATAIWARRLEGEPVTTRASEADYPTIDDATGLLERGQAAFERLVATYQAEPARLASLWSYRNLDGHEVTVPLWSVFRHVVNHATYHRGQIAAKFGRLGASPAKTDLIFWAVEVARDV